MKKSIPQASILLKVIFWVLFFLISANNLNAQADTIPPKMSFVYSNPIWMNLFSTFIEPGLIVTDNKDLNTRVDTHGNFYSNFPNGKATMAGCYWIFYIASDSSGNIAAIKREIIVVDTEPAISLKGDSLVCLVENDLFVDSGHTEIKCFESKREGCLKDSSRPNTGIYKFRYNAGFTMDGKAVSSGWRYVFVKSKNDSSSCKLPQNLKDTCQQLYTGLVSKNTQTNNEFKIYPNPASKNLFISSQSNNVFKLILYDMLGKTMYENNFSQNLSIDVSAMPKGVYFVRSVNIVNNTQSIHKIIIQ